MDSSSSKNTEIDHIPIGYVRKAHGIRGDVVVRGLVEDAGDRFVGDVILTTNRSPLQTFRVVSARMTNTDYLVHLEGVESRTDAEMLVGTQFVIDRSQRRELASDEWWPEDLIGCAVVTRGGERVGVVVEVVPGAAQDRLVIETLPGVRGEVPFVSELVPEIDIDSRTITVDLPAGLIGD
ncbi:MAG: ribosome maturation factor RimM [Actinomycetia bacterium]|nr:ribosome maturation factor RimM [Actinomycetes bacterium]